MFLKPDTDYDSNIKLNLKQKDLYNVYEQYYDITFLPKTDVQEMRHN